MKNNIAIISEVCSVCGQGRILVADGGNDSFYLLCEDCESEWDKPEFINDTSTASHNKHKFVEYVSIDRLQENPWYDFILNK